MKLIIMIRDGGVVNYEKNLRSSVPDPWHFDVDPDPDPRIHASD